MNTDRRDVFLSFVLQAIPQVNERRAALCYFDTCVYFDPRVGRICGKTATTDPFLKALSVLHLTYCLACDDLKGDMTAATAERVGAFGRVFDSLFFEPE
jgi:hypothetical protein